ncbi:MAG: uracil phosphoribosyltransferase, partial [Bacillota bacterium]|nr:uracil phosphoribosyltransferase [Bacillota bacterium]
MGKLIVLDHPLIQHKLTFIRDKNTGSKDFRELVTEVSRLMAYEVTRDFPLEDVEIETPICSTVTKVLSGKKMGIVPILRAGLGMVEGFLSIVPSAKVGHIGMYRDPDSLEPVEYYAKLPQDIHERGLIILEPMLATGGTASAAITYLKKKGAKDIRLVCLIGCPTGVSR